MKYSIFAILALVFSLNAYTGVRIELLGSEKAGRATLGLSDAEKAFNFQFNRIGNYNFFGINGEDITTYAISENWGIRYSTMNGIGYWHKAQRISITLGVALSVYYRWLELISRYEVLAYNHNGWRAHSNLYFGLAFEKSLSP